MSHLLYLGICASLFIGVNAQDDVFSELEQESTGAEMFTNGNTVTGNTEDCSAIPITRRQTVSRANDLFDELEIEINRRPSQTYNEVEAEMDAMIIQYRTALTHYKQEIGTIWENIETSDKTSYVRYSSDFCNKQVVDYKNNEIRISLTGMPLNSMQLLAIIENDLRQLFETTPNQARATDPVLAAINFNRPAQDNISEKSILSELAKPIHSSDNYKAVANELLSNAEIKTTPAHKEGYQPVTEVRIKIPSDSVFKRAKKYSKFIKDYAVKNQLDEFLVYAIIHTESAFNPTAHSPIPAFGLMQIAPKSTGREISEKLYNRDQIFTPEYLFNAENNIEAGTTYLNIIYYTYLTEIENPLSRTYCMIAAYNTGLGNVARAFTSGPNIVRAATEINRLSPQEVYNTLLEKLPYQETRKYLSSITSLQSKYRKGI